MKRIIFAILIALAGQTAAAQEMPYRAVVRQLAKESPLFESLEAQCIAQKASALSGSLFESPEIEFGYYGGTPSEIGRRWDLSVSQSFDMPTVYANRNAIRNLQGEQAGASYRLRYAELVAQIQNACAELAYRTECLNLTERSKENMARVAEQYQRRMEQGDCTILEYNQAMMALAEAEGKLAEAQIAKEGALRKLETLNGGKSVAFEYDTFPVLNYDLSPLAFDETYGNQLATSYLQDQRELRNKQAEAELRYAQSGWMPSIQIGYASENVVAETFRGATLGLSIPLWSNRNKVEAAKNNQSAIASQTELEQASQRAYYETLYKRACSLKASIEEMRGILAQHNNAELLDKALTAGEIGLESYLRQMESLNEFERAILDRRHELEQAVIELNKPLIRIDNTILKTVPTVH